MRCGEFFGVVRGGVCRECGCQVMLTDSCENKEETRMDDEEEKPVQPQNKLVVQPDRKIEIVDGLHSGVVTKYRIRDSEAGYSYLDYYLSVDGVDVGGKPFELKAGYPLPVQPSSMAGELYARFSVPVMVGVVVEPAVLVGRRVRYMTVDKKSARDGKVYTEVLRETLKPVEKEEVV